MALSDVEIFEAFDRDEVTIDPSPDVTQINPASIDLRLGPIIHHFRPSPGGIDVDLRRVKINDFIRYATDTVDLSDRDSWVLEQGHFAIGYTRERVALSSALLARVEGRSTLARFGLSVHNTAPTIQPGWDGVIALEFTNVGAVNLKLSLDLIVCQLILERLGRPASTGYSGSFQNQSGRG